MHPRARGTHQKACALAHFRGPNGQSSRYHDRLCTRCGLHELFTAAFGKEAVRRVVKKKKNVSVSHLRDQKPLSALVKWKWVGHMGRAEHEGLARWCFPSRARAYARALVPSMLSVLGLRKLNPCRTNAAEWHGLTTGSYGRACAMGVNLTPSSLSTRTLNR